MSSTARKLMSASGASAGEVLNVEDVFSTYLYDGTGSTQTITNGIDLDGEGGLVWIKSRSNGVHHYVNDTARGAGAYISPSRTNAESTSGNAFTSFNSDGFTLGSDSSNYGTNYNSGRTYASWTFRKAPKFFDVVEFTTGSSTTDTNRRISHSLGSVPGFIIIKSTDNSLSWLCYHRSLGRSKDLSLNATAAAGSTTNFWGTAGPTSTDFGINETQAVVANANYIAYLFAHNDGDGEFGPDADQDIIKCGVAEMPSGNTDVTVNLGFEPQFILMKDAGHAGAWYIFDTMRGWTAQSGTGTTLSSSNGGATEQLSPNTTNSENTVNFGGLTSTGFKLPNDLNHGDGATDYVYIAIRRGTKVPESGTEVFAVDEGDGVGAVSAYTSGFPVDFAIDRTATATSPNYVGTRLLQGKRMQTDDYDGETSESAYYFDYMEGWRKFSRAAGNYSYMWKRAPSFFDLVAYTGNSTAGRTVTHNLGVAPEMMWVKKTSEGGYWRVYHKGLNGGTNPEQYGINLNLDEAEYNDSSLLWNSTAPTASVFSLGTQGNVNFNGTSYIAYLFATLAGISKVGSFTHSSGTATNVDCGFSSGARFILVKRSNTTGDWMVWDTERGIVAGDDPYLELNNTNAEITGDDLVDPLSSGFTFTGGNGDGTYIFYAIA